MKVGIIGSVLVLAAGAALAMDPATCPMHEQHMKQAAARGDAAHGAEVDGRHDTLVASHETTRHTFRLFEDGGAIELRAKAPAAAETVDAVRTHLREIAAQFASNDFGTPEFVHGRQPAGIADMHRLHASIAFRYEDVDGGGRIRMTTADAAAVSAIHDFMKFQIIEHRTGDSTKVQPVALR
jgi:hypothetical protein